MADNNNLPTKRKRTLNPKLTSEDNVHQDAVKRRQALQSHTKTSGATGHSSRRASVEVVDDPEDHVLRNAGRPKNPNSILESTDDELDEAGQHATKRRKGAHSHAKTSGAVSNSSRRASVEVVDDPEDHIRRNAGLPKNPNSILESTNDEIGRAHV